VAVGNIIQTYIEVCHPVHSTLAQQLLEIEEVAWLEKELPQFWSTLV
jgi:hypothetical protein